MSIAHKEKTRREIGFTTSWDAKEWTGRRWAMNWAWAEAPRSVFMTLGTTDCFVGNFLCCCFSVASRKLSARFFVSCALFCVGCRACYCAWFAASHSPSLLLHLIYLCVCVCVSYDGEKMLSALDNTGRPGSGSFGALCCCCCCPCCYTACHYAFRHARQGDRDNHHQHFKRIKMINKGTTTQKVQKRSIEKMIQLVFSFRNASLSFNFVWREDSVPCRESFRCVCALYGCI